MKNTKALTRFLAVLVMALVLVVSAGCGKEEPAASSGTCTVALSTGEVFSVPLDEIFVKEGLISILDWLKAEGKLDYTSNDAGYGAYLTSVGDGIKEDPANGVYVYIYTSVEADFDVSDYAQTMEYEGKTLTSSGVGASLMLITDGAVIYIGTIQY